MTAADPGPRTGVVVPPVGRGTYVDAHVHFWDPARFAYPWLASTGPLNRPFLPGDLRASGATPAGVVAVEADRLTGQALAEARWLSELTEAALPIVAVVAHAPLEQGAGGAGEALKRLAALPRVTGIRRLLQDEPAGFGTSPGFVAGAGLIARTRGVLELCVRRHQLVEATELARRLPQVTFVLDHLGKPEIHPTAFSSWAADITRLAALPNVLCKLSGLATEAEPGRRDPAHLVPFLRHAVDVFGPGRCMFGSDWPVLTLAMGYGQWLRLVRDAVADLTGDEQDHVMRRSALAAYQVLPGGPEAEPCP